MKGFIPHWLLILLVSLHLAGPGAARAGGWISLPGWADKNGFKLVWLKPNESFALTNQGFDLSLKIGSSVALINGVCLWLCDPIMQKNGQVWVSSLDLKTSLEPILFPRTNRAGAGVHTICLDPGHGGKDTGGEVGRYLEKNYTLPLAEELAELLQAQGFKVMLTRTNDTFIELGNRPGLAGRQKADLFISLHFNIGPPQAKGIEVYCLTPPGANSTNAGRGAYLEGWSAGANLLPGNHCNDQNVLLAYELQKCLVGSLRANDRGLRRARFAVLRTATMPAVLIEGGFLSDTGDRDKIADPKYREQIAAAIVQGVRDYQNLLDNPSSNKT
jgi:N-acetylmuramoyl-L-alanine amidase